jgi:NAD(P)-dependent dehydrogenase (short-subunit alcohol dehydrogenase family)
MNSSALTKKRALVTGAGRGIGRRIATALAAAGAQVGLMARTRSQLETVAREVSDTGGETAVFPGDVGLENDVRMIFQAFVERFGGIDILVNNAAITGPIGPTQEIDSADWERTIRVNLSGCFLSTRYALPYMIAQGSGKIINLSGGGAVGPRPRFGAYSASKAAVVRFTETVAAEVAEHGIDVNAIAPGPINTAMLDAVIEAGDAAGYEAEEALKQKAGGGADPARAAALAVFLASERSDGLSGRLISALWDDWETLDIEAVMASEMYAVRRIKKPDR